MAQIAFLGTGLLGSAFAEAAAKRGDVVTAWNRSANKVEALAAFGVKAAATPADAVRDATRVHLVLKDDAVVEEVIAAARPGLADGAVVIDHSTTLPALTVQRAARLHDAGVKYLHCPVFMAPAAARNAQGTMLVSGPGALYDIVKDELAKMTRRVKYLGERQDLAAANKLLGNALIIGLVAVMADVLTLAQASDIGSMDAIALLKLLDLNGMVDGRGTNMAKGNFTPSFELAMARKDVALMLELAGNRPLAALPGVQARMDALIAKGHGADDVCMLGIDTVRRD
ncbi:NAD(P)-dependent oxidoreductase [Noviherbaspirillum galbum]|uniref:NAD(P)-dependent oxidoreductase n=1 Tax=Noviherbaspirillum galbum TaxID=2709383 RepID=A0A6B3SK41_9BURK|nr:NAD(P)-binding domain-containing protein [Noviherbaspirillum galbum]NEX61090.1 NAD(P)-dependent oxidoreductase [Noviherbaspirillum galbum]